MVALHGYLEGYHPPGITNPMLWKRVGRVLLDAHRAAVRAVRAGSAGSATGLAVQLPLLAPARDDEACQAFFASMRHEIVDLYLDGLERAGQRRLARRAVLPQAVGRPGVAHALRRSAAGLRR